MADEKNSPGRQASARNAISQRKMGQSEGTPQGKQSIERLLLKVSGEPVKVTSNGKTRRISKIEAALLQLTNKAVGGDLKAIRELLAVRRAFVKPEQTTEKSPKTEPDDKRAPLVILTSVPWPF